MYQLTHTTAIRSLSDGAWIPDDPENSDYAEYLRWRAEGNTPLPAEIPDSMRFVPQQVTRAQGKAALVLQGHWGAVLEYVDKIPDSTQKLMANIALHDTLTWDRASPFLVAAATQLGMSETDLDNLFIAASEIKL